MLGQALQHHTSVSALFIWQPKVSMKTVFTRAEPVMDQDSSMAGTGGPMPSASASARERRRFTPALRRILNAMPRDLRILHCASEMLPFVKGWRPCPRSSALPSLALVAPADLDVRGHPGYRRALQEVPSGAGCPGASGATSIHRGRQASTTMSASALPPSTAMLVHLLACNEQRYGREYDAAGRTASHAYDDNCPALQRVLQGVLALPGFSRSWKPHMVRA